MPTAAENPQRDRGALGETARARAGSSTIPRPQENTMSFLADVVPLQSVPPAPLFDTDYWLAHCEGFRVEFEGGRVGFVEEIRSSGDGRPVLAVRAGALGRRLLLIGADDVAFVVPRAERIYLHSTPHLVGTVAA
jgi:hypothetical protein